MRFATAGAVLLLAGQAIACSSDDDAAEGDSAVTTTEQEQRSTNAQAAEFGGPLEGGKGIFLATAGGGPSLDEAGFTEAEYSASGTATSYSSAGPLPADGMFDLQPGPQAEFATRVVVRRPADAEDFNGTAVVEWLNVSAGADSAPDYTYLADELLREGYAWIGVSAQRIGIEGGAVAVAVPGAEEQGLGQGLKAQDPERYGDLNHPGDGYSYDIYTQVAQALRSPGELDPLEGLDVTRVLAAGESQSAFALTTYVNGVQPLTDEFDGFLIHSRGGAPAPLGDPEAAIEIASAIGGEPTAIRTDGEAPVIVVQTESDVIGVLNYLPARQPDDERFRLWEIAGTAHADAFQVGAQEEMLGCAQQINRGQQVFVLRAALRHLNTWAQGGAAPPEAPRLEVDESAAAPSFLLDELGNVTGGVRTPAVEAPVDVLSGMSPEGSSIICLLMGSTTPLSDEQLDQLYGSRDDYLTAYEAATDEAIEAGFTLADDREQILDGADPSRIPDSSSR